MIKNKIYSLLLVAIFTITSSFGANKLWVGTTSSWNTASNWNPSGVPGASDIAIFNSGTPSCNIDAVVSVAGLQMNTGYTGTITQNANAITIAASNALFAAGTFTGGSAAITITGTFTLSGTTFTSTSNTLTLSSGVTSTSGTFTHNSGTVTFSSAASQTIPLWSFNNLTISGSRTTQNVTLAGGTINIAGTFTNSATFTIGGYVVTSNIMNFNGVAQNIPAITPAYNDLTCSGTGNKTATAALTINGLLTINSGRTFNMSTFQLLGSTITSSGTGILQTAYVATALPIPITKTWTFGVQYTSASAQTIVDGTYVDLNGTGGARTLSSTGTINISGIFTPGAGAYTVTSSTVNFNGAAQNISAFTFNNLTCSTSSSTKTATGALVVNGALTINSSVILTMGTANILSGTISSISGTGLLQTGVPTATSATPIPASKTWTMSVEFNGVAQSIVAGTYANLTCSGTGNKTATAALTINGLLTINSGRTLNMSTFQLLGSTITSSGTGILQTAYVTTALPIPVTKTWTFGVQYTSASAQTIVDGTYLDLNGTGGARTLSSTGTINISGIFTPGAGAYTVTSSTVNFNGAAQNVSAFTFNNLTCSTSSSTKTATGALVVNGVLTINTSVILTMGTANVLSGTLTSISGTGLLQTAVPTATSATPIPASKTWTTSVEFNGVAQSVVAGTYANLTCSGTGDKTATGAIVVSSILNISSGRIFDLSTNLLTGITSTLGTGSLKTANVSATPIPVSKTWTFGVLYNSASAQTIVNGTYVDLNGTGGARTLSSTGIIGVSGIFTVGAGAYTVTGSTVDFNGTGSQTIPASNYYNLTYSSTGSRTLASSGSILVANRFTKGANQLTTTGSTVNYNGTAGQTIIAINYNNLTISGNHGASNDTLANSGVIGIAGVFSVTATGGFTITTSSVSFNGAAQNIPAFTFNTLQCSGSSTKTATGSIVVNGTLAIAAGIVLDMGASANVLSGTFTTSATGLLKTQNNSATPIPSGKIFSFAVEYYGTLAQSVVTGTYVDLTVSGTRGANSITFASGTINISGVFTNTATATSFIVTTNVINYNGAGAQSVIAFNYNDLTISGTRASNNVTLASSGTIGVAGVYTTSATFQGGSIVVTGSTINYNGTAAQTVTLSTYNHLTISGTHGANVITLPAGTINVKGNFSNSLTSGTITATSGNIMLFNGTVNQYIGGTVTAGTSLAKLSVNKASGKVLLSRPTTLIQQLILTKGIIGSSATNFLQINYSAAAGDTLIGGSDSSYVCGPINKIGNQTFIFPLGDTVLATGAYHPLKISAPSATTDGFKGQYFAANQNFGTTLQVDSLASISTCEYFDLTRSAGTSTVIPTVSWNTNSCNVATYDDLRAAYYDSGSSQWKTLGAGITTVKGPVGTVAGSFGFSATLLHLVIGKFGIPTNYCTFLRRELDGGYHIVNNGNLTFKYDEEYVDQDGKLKFNIYNMQNTVIATNLTMPTALQPSVVFADNRITLNIASCTFTPTGNLGSGFFILEVINEKNEKWYLRFKHNISIYGLCTGTGTWAP